MLRIWQITKITNPTGVQLWFSDSLPVLDYSRNGNGLSYRLIVQGQGFLDITELDYGATPLGHLDFNGCVPVVNKLGQDTSGLDVISVSLTLPGDGTFSVEVFHNESRPEYSTSGPLKPLPVISEADIKFIDEMIQQKYVPYPPISSAPGKTTEELQELGKKYFPFTPYSFELATAIYDWTTASFARMVFNKVFEYTSILPEPFALDENSIALMIWETNWDTYNPGDKDYMNSFMMEPASSLEDVKSQLTSVRDRLHKLSDVENRLLVAACQAMPRTSLVVKPQLYSGQVDVYQFGLDRFGIEFLQCPLNAGPVGTELIIPFASVMSSYVSEGRVITTKTVWSFTDSVQDAIHYSNGILLVANPPDDNSWVWEGPSYVTPLSDNPAKTEYTFPFGTSFLVQKVEQATLGGKQVVIINLQPASPEAGRDEGIPRRDFKVAPLSVAEYAKHAESYSPELERNVEIIHAEGVSRYKLPHRTGGRRCRCLDVAEGRITL